MKLVLISILLILSVSCETNTPDWHILDFGEFKLKTPGRWKEFEEKGIDSYVGGLTNGNDTLWFDYGKYSAEVGEENPIKHKFAEDTINGLKAKLVVPITPGHGYIRMFIQVNEDIRFSIGGRNIQSTDTILKIYKSIVFKESDTSINGVLTMSKFIELPHAQGKILFKQKCGACHSISLFVEAPDMKTLIADRSTDWLYNFFTKRELVADDSAHLMWKRLFNNIECAKIPDITKEEIESIKNYIMSR